MIGNNRDFVIPFYYSGKPAVRRLLTFFAVCMAGHIEG